MLLCKFSRNIKLNQTSHTSFKPKQPTLQISRQKFQTRTQQHDIPEKYLDTLTNELMEDPVESLTTGEIYDKKTIDQNVQYEFKSRPDLQNEIQQWKKENQQSTESPNKNLEILDKENMVKEKENNKQDTKKEWLEALEKYEEKMQRIQSQNKVVEKIFTEMEAANKQATSTRNLLQKQVNKFGRVLKLSYLVNANKPLQNNRIEIKKFVDSKEILKKSGESCAQSLLDFSDKQKQFDLEYEKLESLKQEIICMEGKLKNLLKKLNFDAKFIQETVTFNKKNNYQQSRFWYENLFQELVAECEDSNTQLQIKSTENHKTINIYGQEVIKNYRFTNIIDNTNNLKYIQINLINSDSSVVIENCDFFGIGLVINGQKNETSTKGIVTIKNTALKNSPENGLKFYNCQSVSLENVDVKNCELSGGLFINIHQCMLQRVVVQNAQKNGLFFENTTAQIKDTTIKNIPENGLQIQNCQSVSIENIDVKNCQLSGGVFINVRQCMLQRVDVQQCQKNGIFFKNSTAEIKDTTIKNIPQNGLQVQNCQSFSLENIDVKNCQLSGGVFNNVHKCMLKRVDVQKCQKNGLFFEDTTAELKDCSIYCCNQYGIFVQNKKVNLKNITFYKNEFGNSEGYGIHWNNFLDFFKFSRYAPLWRIGIAFVALGFSKDILACSLLSLFIFVLFRMRKVPEQKIPQQQKILADGIINT